jgi:hypothetical protein
LYSVTGKSRSGTSSELLAVAGYRQLQPTLSSLQLRFSYVSF